MLKRILVVALVALGVASEAVAAPISTYPAASALDGTEKIFGTQGTATVNITPAQIGTYVSSNPAAVTGPYAHQQPQTVSAAIFNQTCLPVASYLTPTNLAKTNAATATTADYDGTQIIQYAIAAAAYNGNAAPHVCLPAGKIPMGSALELKNVVWLQGQGGAGGLAGAPSATILSFPANMTGITVNRYNTLNGGTISPTTTAADGSVLEGFSVVDAASTWTDPTIHPGIWRRARAVLRNINVAWSAGNSVQTIATMGSGGATEGNANESVDDTVNVQSPNGAYAFYVDGSDVNGGHFNNDGVLQSGLGGVYESSFLGNLWTGFHVDSSGSLGLGLVTASGHIFACYSDHTSCSTTTPTVGMSSPWRDTGAGSGPAAWVSGGNYWISSAVWSDGGGGNAPNIFSGGYVETGLIQSHVASPSMVFGGQGNFDTDTSYIRSCFGVGNFVCSYTGMGGFVNLATGDARGTYTAGYAAPDGFHSICQNCQDSRLGWASPAFYAATTANLDQPIGWTAATTSGTKTFRRTTGCRSCVWAPVLGIGANGSEMITGTATSLPSSTGFARGERYWNITAGTTGVDKWVISAQGTPDTYFADYAYPRADPSAGIGYVTGAGGAVTQATSRTTGVTLNKVTGAITLVSAAGSATAFTFTVTNSTVAATDTISVNVGKAATDRYLCSAAPAAGSFDVTCIDQTGTTTEQPVINFNVIKGAAS